MSEQTATLTSTRRALTQQQAADYIGMSDKFLQSPRGKKLFPPVRIGGRSVYFSDLLDLRINELAIESGALPGGQS